MPELPEVETIAKCLTQDICGAEIQKCRLFWDGVLSTQHSALAQEDFFHAVTGATVRGVWRRGKVLVIDIVTKRNTLVHLAFHLRMTGGLIVGVTPPRYTHLEFLFTDGRRLYFRDMRKFGSCRAMLPSALNKWPFWACLGPEPFALSSEEFSRIFSHSKQNIKARLLNQHCIAGIGNIYADESLFRAGISPHAVSKDLSLSRLEYLHAILKEVLYEAILANGSSLSDYVDARGDAGAFQNAFRVYGRAGQPCLACNTPLCKGKVAGRTTVWCEKCQKKE